VIVGAPVKKFLKAIFIRANHRAMALLDRLVAAMQGRWISLPRGQGLADRVAAARQKADLSLARLAQLAGAIARLAAGR